MNPQGTPTGPDILLGQSEPRTPEYSPIDPEVRDLTLTTLSEANVIALQSPIPETSTFYNNVTAEYNDMYHEQQGDIRMRIDALRAEVDPEICERIDITNYSDEVNQILISVDVGEINNALNSIIFENGDIDIISNPLQAIPIKINIIRDIIAAHPSFADHLVENELFQIFGLCPLPGSEEFNTIASFIQEVKETYIESREAPIYQNLLNYFQNQDIPIEQEGEYFHILEELEQSGVLTNLSEELRSGDCSIQYISTIRDFTDVHFGDLGINFSFTSEDANNIIGSVITARRAEQEIALIGLREDIFITTGRPVDEIQEIFNIQDTSEKQARIELLLQEIDDENERRRIGEEIEDLLQMELVLERQESNLGSISAHAAEIYGMASEDIQVLYSLILEGQTVEKAVKIMNVFSYNSFEASPAELLNDVKGNIYSIRNVSTLIWFFNTYSEECAQVKVSDLHPSMRGQLSVLMNLPSIISASDTLNIPEEFFLQGMEGQRGVRGLIQYGLTQNNSSFVENILLRTFYANGGTPGFGLSIIDIILDNPGFSIEKKEFLRQSIPEQYWRTAIERGILSEGHTETSDEETFDQNVNYLLSIPEGEREEDILPVIQSVESYILTNSTISQNEALITNLIQKGYIHYATKILLAIGLYIPSIEDSPNISENPYLRLQSELIQKSPNFIAYFSEDNRSHPNTLSLFIQESNNIAELRRIYPYFNITDLATLRIVYNSISNKFGENGAETAKVLMGSDRGIIDLLQRIIDRNTLNDEDKELVFGILDYTQELHELNEQAKANLDAIESGEMRRNKISLIINELGISNLGESHIEDILRIYESGRISPESLGRLAEIIPENQVENFIVRLAETMQEETLQTLDSLYIALYELGVNQNNSPEFQRLFSNESFHQDEFQNLFQAFITRNQITAEGLENPIEEIQLFLQELHLSEEQRNILEQILNHELNLTFISPYTNSEVVETDLHILRTDGIEGVRDSQRRRLDTRISTGNLLLTTTERSGERRFNYNTGELEENPNYIPPEEGTQESNSEESQTIPPLTPQNISSPDLQQTYTDISSELNLTPEESQSLTEDELQMIAGSEQVRESFVGFRNTLQELGLADVWKYRNQIFTAIGSLDFNLNDGDYIGENELNIFLSKTVYATTQDARLRETPSNLETTLQIVRTLNHQTGGPNDIDTVNSVGEGLTLLEYSFREQFAPRNSGLLVFEMSRFKDALKGNSDN